jgi:hypothetical protein
MIDQYCEECLFQDRCGYWEMSEDFCRNKYNPKYRNYSFNDNFKENKYHWIEIDENDLYN